MRIYFFYTILIVGLLILSGRLFELQIIKGAQNRAIAEGNRIRKVELPTVRGVIYDRNGNPLTRNVPLFRLAKKENDQIVGWTPISRDEALDKTISGQTSDLREDVGREYLYGPTLAHLLGYLGEVSADEVQSGQYNIGDLIGRTGIEQQYDSLLRGKPGGELIEVDAAGTKIRDLGREEPIPGQELKLSIDADLSKVAFDGLEGKQGAVIVTEVKTGRVLVLVSSPSYDPNLFKDLLFNEKDQQAVQQILTNSNQPMYNRAIGANYPPGSTFKLITSTAGLESGKITRDWMYNDTGQVKVGEYVYNNWYYTEYGKTEGEINVVTALKRSTDTFFYKLGEAVGAESLAIWARKFGLGSITGIDLPGEVAGSVLDPQTLKEQRGESWYLGNTYHFAIGQGFLLATPLQINMMTQAIANGGKLCKPRIADVELGSTSDECQDLGISKETLNIVIDGMKEACLPRGTAFPFFEFKPQVACKTGTAEYGDPKAGKTHAWFTAFAPVDDPQIVVTSILEGGGEGSYVAAPVAKKVMEKYFNK